MRAALIETLGSPPEVGDLPEPEAAAGELVAVRAEAHAELLAHVAAGAIRLAIERVALEDVTGAWTRQAAGAGVKLVVEPRR